uniref:Uncharacterized protein n=1 Tax=Nothobranchius furzeri TaxID=105023 RepID=A0A8C6PBX1_NOTFU
MFFDFSKQHLSWMKLHALLGKQKRCLLSKLLCRSGPGVPSHQQIIRFSLHESYFHRYSCILLLFLLSVFMFGLLVNKTKTSKANVHCF